MLAHRFFNRLLYPSRVAFCSIRCSDRSFLLLCLRRSLARPQRPRRQLQQRELGRLEPVGGQQHRRQSALERGLVSDAFTVSTARRQQQWQWQRCPDRIAQSPHAVAAEARGRGLTRVTFKRSNCANNRPVLRFPSHLSLYIASPITNGVVVVSCRLVSPCRHVLVPPRPVRLIPPRASPRKRKRSRREWQCVASPALSTLTPNCRQPAFVSQKFL